MKQMEVRSVPLTIFDNGTTLQPNDPLCALGKFEIVGHQQQGCSYLAIQTEKQVDHHLTRFSIKVPGRFIGKQDAWLANERTGQGHALLFASRQLDGIMVQSIPQPDTVEQIDGVRFRSSLSAQFERDHHIFKSSEGGDQLEGLKNETDRGTAKRRQCFFIQRVESDPIKLHRASGWTVEPGTHTEKRGFAAA
jgi:hypothetical protein